jgi:hypothetical protein
MFILRSAGLKAIFAFMCFFTVVTLSRPTPAAALQLHHRYISSSSFTNQNTLVLAEVTLPGIGNTGSDNNNPIDGGGEVDIQIFNVNGTLMYANGLWAFYYSTTGSYKVFFTLPNYWPNVCDCSVNLRFHKPINTLWAVAQPHALIYKGETYTLPPTPLLSGDINGDGSLGKDDYDILVACFGSKQCPPDQKSASDLDRNGVVNGVDYNIFLRDCYQVSCK